MLPLSSRGHNNPMSSQVTKAKKDFPALSDDECALIERFSIDDLDEEEVIDLLIDFAQSYLVAHTLPARLLLLQKLLNVAGIYQLIPFYKFTQRQESLEVVEIRPVRDGEPILPTEVPASDILLRMPFAEFADCPIGEGGTLRKVFNKDWFGRKIHRVLFFSDLPLVPEGTQSASSFSEPLSGTICIRVKDLTEEGMRDPFSLLVDVVKQVHYLQQVYQSTERLIPTHIRAGMTEGAIRFLIAALRQIEATKGETFVDDAYRNFIVEELFLETATQFCSYVEAGPIEGKQRILSLVEEHGGSLKGELAEIISKIV